MRRRWLSPVAALAVVVALTLLAPATGPVQDHRKPRDIARIRKSIARTRAKIVVVGNSIVGHGVCDRTLTELIDVPVYRLWRNSMRSAWWYLALKNVIAQIEPGPEIVVICFRDTVLTDPTRAVTGKHKAGIGQLATDHEPLLDRLAYFTDHHHVDLFFQRHWTLFQHRDRLQQLVELKVHKHVARRLFDEDWDEDEVEEAIERVLADEHMDEELITAAQAAAEQQQDEAVYDFHARLQESFLPHIIDQAQRNGIKLIFARIKTLRDAARDEARERGEPAPPPCPKLASYIRHLRHYLAAHDMPMLDFTTTPHIKRRHFREHDHLCGNGRQIFTRLLADALRPHLPES